jgi:hypothetical protein
MAYSQAAAHKARTDPSTDFDAIIIGAGVSGLYQLYKLRELGLKVRVFEAGTGVGGTWYWNRYPGARFDSESWTYGYSFSQELLEEWDWEEHFAGQPETERYLNYVADKFDLRRDIQFKSRVRAALSGGYAQLGRRAGKRQALQRAVPDHRRRRAFSGDDADHPRRGDVPRPILPHPLLAKGTGSLRGQTGRSDRHRRDRRADHYGSGQDRRPSDRVPANAAMVRAIAQRQDR